MYDFASKVVVVTGAANGIGSEIAKSFSKHKASLCLVDIDESNLKVVAKECLELGAKQVEQVTADLSKKGNIENVITETIAKLGGIDVLVNNAGITSLGGVEEANIDDFDRVFAINVKAPLYFMQLASPHLVKSQGNVVNITSYICRVPITGSIIYAMSKAAIEQLTKVAALELAGKGVRVNAVSPGTVHTSIINKLGIPDEHVQGLFKNEEKLHVLGSTLVTTEEVARAVIFLASDEANMMTGANLLVDRGRVLSGSVAITSS